MFDWFKDLAKGEARSMLAAPEAGQNNGGIEESVVVHGLDFTAAIMAHRKWRERLEAHIAGKSDETLDAKAVCRDDLCALGKWLHGPNAVFLSNLPSYPELKETHARFHLSAGEIISAAQAGNLDTARRLLSQGTFPNASIKVQILIARLMSELKGW